MANIKLEMAAVPFTGQIVTFTAPCDCEEVADGLVIDGQIYTIVDALGEKVAGVCSAWRGGAKVSVILDVENKQAFLQNMAVTPAAIGAAPAGHTHTAADVGAAAASHNHSATEIASGTLPIARGGTGATTKANARKNIGVFVQSSAPSGASGDLWAW